MSSFDSGPSETGADDAVRYSHKVHLFGSREVKGQTTYLVRLRREVDYHMSFFLKKASDFVELRHQLQKDADERMWGEATDIHVIPEMPTEGRFGFRKRLSMLGMHDFVAVQAEQIQEAMDRLMCQVTDISKDSTLAAFFTEDPHEEATAAITDWVKSLRSPVHLLVVMGFWRLAGSKRTWTVHSDGTVSLNNRRIGDEFDLLETGNPHDLGRVITRRDGWTVDLERSSKDQLIWVSPGMTELVWNRVQKEDAETVLRRIDEIKRNQRMKNEEEQRQAEIVEQARIREVILKRAAAAKIMRASARPVEEVAEVPRLSEKENEESASDEDLASTAPSDDKAADSPRVEEQVVKAPSTGNQGDESAVGKTISGEEAAAATSEADAVALAGALAEAPEGSD